MNIFKKCLLVFYVLVLSFLSFLSLASDDTQQTELNQAQLAQILAPIALYPDSILTHILIASTYPLEIVQAQLWLVQHPDLDNNEIATEVENKDWDASVKALMPFPRVIKRLNDDLLWTQKLGDAFLQNEQQVLASIQSLRKKADQAGSLDQMDNMDIKRATRTIIIQSAQPDIVYVPYYDSRYVYGDWYWNNYPPVYWTTAHYNHHYYRTHNSPFYWDLGVSISFNYFFNAFNWQNHHVVVVNNFHPRYRNSYGYGYQLNRHNMKAWRHNPSHRRGVAYRSEHIKQRYHSNRPSISASKGHNRSLKIAQSGGFKPNGEKNKHSGNTKAFNRANKHQKFSQQLRYNRKKSVTSSEHKFKRAQHNAPKRAEQYTRSQKQELARQHPSPVKVNKQYKAQYKEPRKTHYQESNIKQYKSQYKSQNSSHRSSQYKSERVKENSSSRRSSHNKSSKNSRKNHH